MYLIICRVGFVLLNLLEVKRKVFQPRVSSCSCFPRLDVPSFDTNPFPSCADLPLSFLACNDFEQALGLCLQGGSGNNFLAPSPCH
jgi:hypothetical protein